MTERINIINEHLKAAHVLRSGSAKVWVDFFNNYKNLKSDILRNRELSNVGQQKQLNQLNIKYEVKALRIAERFYNEHTAHLNLVLEEADKILLEQAPKVDDNKKRLFEIKVKQLEGDIMYATSAEEGRKALEKLVEAADEQGLALVVHENMDRYTTYIQAAATNNENKTLLRKGLGQLYREITTKSLPAGASQAFEAIEAANSWKNISLVSDIVLDRLGEISRETKQYANQTHIYFAAYKQHVKDVEGGNYNEE